MAKEKAPKTVVEAPKEKRVEIPKISFEDYVKEQKVHLGLVASFSYEAGLAGDDLSPRTSEEWKNALDAQSKRAY